VTRNRLATVTAVALALLNLGLLSACGGSGGGGNNNNSSDSLSIAEAVGRDADGVAIHLGETIQTEGVVTVDAGVYANNKLKIFTQDGADGIMVYHESAAEIAAFQEGEKLRVTGVIGQEDPTSDSNRAIGTVLVNVTSMQTDVLSTGNALPEPLPITLQTLTDEGNDYVGTLIVADNVRKESGSWPVVGDRSKQVTIIDDTGATAILRFQRNTITQEMADKLAVIGDDPYTLIGILVQDDTDDNGTLFGGYEVWPRSAADIVP